MCVRSKLEVVDSEEQTPACEVLEQKLSQEKRVAMHKYAEGEVEYAATNNPEDAIKKDMLAVVTEQYQQLLSYTADMLTLFQQSKTYRVVFRTSQPAHLITIVSVACIAAIVFPRQTDTAESRPSTLANFIYLLAFITHFGAQVWMTFVSGLSLYFALPRHTFGSVQIVLFPKYFGINSFLSLITLIVFVNVHPSATWDTQLSVQVCAMVTCFFAELVIRIYLTPPMLKLIAAKTAIEKAAGVGLEVGQHSVGSLAMCPHYVGLHKAFRNVHITVASGNIVAMACTTLHLWYLANKIC